jgi:hypothetical protein
MASSQHEAAIGHAKQQSWAPHLARFLIYVVLVHYVMGMAFLGGFVRSEGNKVSDYMLLGAGGLFLFGAIVLLLMAAVILQGDLTEKA